MNDEENFSEMLKNYKKIVQIPFEKYKELTKEDTKETFQYMVHKMANNDIKIFEKLELQDELIKLQDKLIKLQEIELDQYKNNWEELKKWINKISKYSYDDNGTFGDVLNKMKELEENN